VVVLVVVLVVGAAMVLVKLPLRLLVLTEPVNTPSVKSLAKIGPVPIPFTVMICELATMVPSVFFNLTMNCLAIKYAQR